MAYILARKQTDGTARYTAVVRLRQGKAIIHQESKTFYHRGAAKQWAKNREVALQDPTALVRAHDSAPTLADLIRWYVDSFETISQWQRSKQTHLRFLENHSIGQVSA